MRGLACEATATGVTAIVDFSNEIVIDDDVTSRMESLLALLAGRFLIGCGDGLFLWRGDLAIICGVLRRFTAFYGVLRRFSAIFSAFEIGFCCRPNIWGAKPPGLFLVVKIIVPKWGGSGPLSPLKTFFLVSQALTLAYLHSENGPTSHGDPA